MPISSYSQYGEDLILKGLMERDQIDLSKKGFYLDVGAHHPTRFSNTKLFYDLGWGGINIEPNEGIKNLFDKTRPRDKTLEIGLGKRCGYQKFFLYNESALNSLNNRNSELSDTPYSSTGSKEIETSRMEVILNDFHGESLPEPNFLDIDVEGLEMEVLEGNNWDKFKFNYILIEQKIQSVDSIKHSPLFIFLSDKGYEILAHNGLTGFYRHRPNLK